MLLLAYFGIVFFFKQKTAYEMRISDWSSDVCSSDLAGYPDGRSAQTGKPLILYFDSAGGMGSSAMLDWMRRQLGALNVQLEVRATDYNRFQDKMRNGSAQMYMWGWVEIGRASCRERVCQYG